MPNMTKSEKTTCRKSLCLGIMSVTIGIISLVLGVVPYVISVMTQEVQALERIHNEYQFFLVPFWFASIAIGVLAIITAHSAKFKVAVVLGCIGVGVTVLFFLGTLFLFFGTISDGRVHCCFEMQDLSNATLKYCEQNEGTLPGADAWCDQLIGLAENAEEYYSQKFLVGGHDLDAIPDGRISDFAFNKNLDGYRLADINRPTVLLFETNPGWNQNGTSAILASKGHPGFWPFAEGGYHFILVGPHSTFTVKFIKNSELDSLNWIPTE